ncbi:MAG TPA: NAD-dependent epimerase/dehydratase family protein [Burkholderiales bacterium]|nr:NAD-dependent epimerase/dehydratase family protein [Burkholderiales bacterium]
MNEGVIVVAGGGGFMGGALVADLRKRGYSKIRSVDIKPHRDWYQKFDDVDNLVLDLSNKEACYQALKGAAEVYNLAADMGGMGFIENNKALCMLSVLINTHLLMAVRDLGAKKYFFASSACVYAAEKQKTTHLEHGLREGDAYPATPEDGYGWEKLFSERMCRHFHEDFGIHTRIARYHNVYGPHGTWDGGREKAPAAICRKVIKAKLLGNREIEIWGDGQQTRSFTFIDDCVIGTEKLMHSDVVEPLNVGSDQMVSINQLVDVVEGIAGIKLRRKYDMNAPKGVRGRNSNNDLIKQRLEWAPSIKIEAGMEQTYAWIYDEIVSNRASNVT